MSWREKQVLPQALPTWQILQQLSAEGVGKGLERAGVTSAASGAVGETGTDGVAGDRRWTGSIDT